MSCVYKFQSLCCIRQIAEFYLLTKIIIYTECNLTLVTTGMQKCHKTKMNEMETLRIHEN